MQAWLANVTRNPVKIIVGHSFFRSNGHLFRFQASLNLVKALFPITFESLFCHLVSIDQPHGNLEICGSLCFDKHFEAEKTVLHFILLAEPVLLGNQWENRSFWVKRLYTPKWGKNYRFMHIFKFVWSHTSPGLPGLVKDSESWGGSFQLLETGRELGWGFRGPHPTRQWDRGGGCREKSQARIWKAL